MTPYYCEDGVTIYHADCRDVLPNLDSSGLLVTSPPYSGQRNYSSDSEPWNDVVPPALALANLSPSGQMLVNLGLVHQDGEVFCYWEPMVGALRTVGYRLFGWYVWDQGHGFPGDFGGRFAPSHEFVFHFNRQPAVLNKCVKSKANFKALRVRLERDGSNISGSERFPVQHHKIPDSVIRAPRSTSPTERNEHPARGPVAVADLMIRAFDGRVLDPFAGSGTTLLAARMLGREAIGIEIEERYCEIAARRLAQRVLPLELGA